MINWPRPNTIKTLPPSSHYSNPIIHQARTALEIFRLYCCTMKLRFTCKTAREANLSPFCIDLNPDPNAGRGLRKIPCGWTGSVLPTSTRGAENAIKRSSTREKEGSRPASYAQMGVSSGCEPWHPYEYTWQHTGLLHTCVARIQACRTRCLACFVSRRASSLHFAPALSFCVELYFLRKHIP